MGGETISQGFAPITGTDLFGQGQNAIGYINGALQNAIANTGNITAEQMGWARGAYAVNAGVTGNVVDQFLQSQGGARDLSNLERARYTGQYMPLEDQLVNEAWDYASPARKAQNMGMAMANVSQNFDAQRENAQQALESYGVDPSSTRFAALDLASRAQQGAAEASAGTQAGLQTEALQRALRSEALNIGQRYPGNIAAATNSQYQGLTGGENAMLAQTASGANSMGTPQSWQALANQAGLGSGSVINASNANIINSARTNQTASTGWGSILGTLGGGLLGGIGSLFGFEEGGAVPDAPVKGDCGCGCGGHGGCTNPDHDHGDYGLNFADGGSVFDPNDYLNKFTSNINVPQIEATAIPMPAASTAPAQPAMGGGDRRGAAGSYNPVAAGTRGQFANGGEVQNFAEGGDVLSSMLDAYIESQEKLKQAPSFEPSRDIPVGGGYIPPNFDQIGIGNPQINQPSYIQGNFPPGQTPAVPGANRAPQPAPQPAPRPAPAPHGGGGGGGGGAPAGTHYAGGISDPTGIPVSPWGVISASGGPVPSVQNFEDGGQPMTQAMADYIALQNQYRDAPTFEPQRDVPVGGGYIPPDWETQIYQYGGDGGGIPQRTATGAPITRGTPPVARTAGSGATGGGGGGYSGPQIITDRGGPGSEWVKTTPAGSGGGLYEDLPAGPMGIRNAGGFGGGTYARGGTVQRFEDGGQPMTQAMADYIALQNQYRDAPTFEPQRDIPVGGGYIPPDWETQIYQYGGDGGGIPQPTVTPTARAAAPVARTAGSGGTGGAPAADPAAAGPQTMYNLNTQGAAGNGLSTWHQVYARGGNVQKFQDGGPPMTQAMADYIAQQQQYRDAPSFEPQRDIPVGGGYIPPDWAVAIPTFNPSNYGATGDGRGPNPQWGQPAPRAAVDPRAGGGGGGGPAPQAAPAPAAAAAPRQGYTPSGAVYDPNADHVTKWGYHAFAKGGAVEKTAGVPADGEDGSSEDDQIRDPSLLYADVPDISARSGQKQAGSSGGGAVAGGEPQSREQAQAQAKRTGQPGSGRVSPQNFQRIPHPTIANPQHKVAFAQSGGPMRAPPYDPTAHAGALVRQMTMTGQRPPVRAQTGGPMAGQPMQRPPGMPGVTPGGNVPPGASPTRGAIPDDVPASLTAGEFVVPKDVAAWKGQEFFHKLIDTSRKASSAPKPATPTVGPAGPAQGGIPSFVSRPGMQPPGMGGQMPPRPAPASQAMAGRVMAQVGGPMQRPMPMRRPMPSQAMRQPMPMRRPMPPQAQGIPMRPAMPQRPMR